MGLLTERPRQGRPRAVRVELPPEARQPGDKRRRLSQVAEQIGQPQQGARIGLPLTRQPLQLLSAWVVNRA